MEKTQFNDSKVSQLFYYDPITDSYIPVSSLNPLPVHVDTTSLTVSNFPASQLIKLDPNSTNPNLDAYGRLRVSEPFTIFDCQTQYDKQPFLMDDIFVGNGSTTFLPNESTVQLNCDTSSGCKVTRRSRQWIRYQPSKCVSGDDYMNLADGSRVKAIDLIDKEFEIFTKDDNEKTVLAKARGFFNAIEPIYKLELQDGRIIYRNSNHPLWSGSKVYLTSDGQNRRGARRKIRPVGWVKLSDIQPGQYVGTVTESPYIGTSYLPDEEIKMLACMIGDGSCTQDAISFSQLDNKLLSEMKEIVENYYDCVFEKDKKYRYRIFKKGFKFNKKPNNVLTALRKHNVWGKNSYTHEVPEIIWKLPLKSTALFLSRLFSADGWAHEKGNSFSIGYCSVSEQLARGVQSLLLKFGIQSILETHHSKLNYKEGLYKSYKVMVYEAKSLLLFCDSIGIYGKEDILNRIREKAYDRFINGKPQDVFLHQNIYDGLKWSLVKSIEIQNIGVTVGIEVDNYHTFLTDFYEHNSQQITMTGVLGSPKANVSQRIGYFDDQNGLFFEQTSAGMSVVRRTYVTGSVVNNVFLQSNWNLDTLDGSGNAGNPSGKLLDPTKGSIFCIDFQWLGLSRARWGINFGDAYVYVHQYKAANVLSNVYMTTGNLPVTYELENTGVSDSSTAMKAVCCAISSEGGSDKTGFIFSNSNSRDGVVSTRKPYLSVQPKLTFNGIVNRGHVVPLKSEMMNSVGGTTGLLYEVVFNGTLIGASFTSQDPNSIVNFDTSATSIIGGTVVDSGFISTSTNVDISMLNDLKYPLTLNAAGTVADTLSIVVTSVSGGSPKFSGSISWKEYH
jgi:intein/homing endonuclease